MTLVAYVVSVDQDQAAKNMQPDLCSILSPLYYNTVDKSNRAILIIRDRISKMKMSDRFIWRSKH